MQEAWSQVGEWDVPLPDELKEKVPAAVTSLTNAFELKFPCMAFTNTCHLHFFADTFGAAAYAVDYDEKTSHLLTSKIRLPPLRKRLTIPKLKMAALTVA